MNLGVILKTIRTKIADVTLKEFSRIILEENPLAKASKSTLVSYENNYREEQVHGGAELYKAIENLYGINIYQSVTGDPIVVVDPTKLRPVDVQLLKSLNAKFQTFPLFNKHIPPFNSEEKYPSPFCLLPTILCPDAEFGMQVVDNRMAPMYNKGDFVFCGELVEKVKPAHTYLLSLDVGTDRTFKIGRTSKKSKEIFLVQANSGSNPAVFPNDAVKGIYEVVGQYRNKTGINLSVLA